MKHNTDHLNRAARYLSGELHTAERTGFETWVDESDENERFFKEVKLLWQHSDRRLFISDDNTLAEWQRLSAYIEKEQRHKLTFADRSATGWLKWAAVFLLGCCVAYAVYFLGNKEIHQSATDEVLTFYLPDSSKVWLNVNSTLSYSKDFGTTSRAITLKGEAYFKVKPRTDVPFTVSTGSALAEVLGTSFNLKEDSASVILTVAEGTVKFSPQHATDDESVKVTARERAELKNTNTIQKSKNTDRNFARWRERNNKLFEAEKVMPTNHLRNNYSWRKNVINQSVIEGTLHNTATLASYENIVLKVTYQRANGTYATARVTIFDKVGPGQRIKYQKRLLDLLTETRSLHAEIESATLARTAL